VVADLHFGDIRKLPVALQAYATKQPLQPKIQFSTMSQIGQKFVVSGIPILSQ
jgi:hypothetical protein